VTLSGLPEGAIAAGTTVTFTVQVRNINWTGKRDGIVYLGPAGSPTAFSVPISVVRPALKLHLPVIFKNVPGA
jgi:hypothetical protein